MDVAVVREQRGTEHRVSLAPWGVKALMQNGHRVWVEAGAGAEAGHPDAAYEAVGAKIAYSRMEVLGRGDLVSAIYAPGPHEYELLRPGQVVVAFWALPTARPEDFRALQAREVTAVAIEAIADAEARAPVLTAMSEIAGGLAVTLGGMLLLNEQGGPGILLGGAPGVPPADVVILGAGVLGRSAARAAIGVGAEVTLLDISVEHLRDAVRGLPGPVRTMLATRANIEQVLAFGDLILGAAAVRGQRAPLLVTRDMMPLLRPRSVVMDFAIDLGGCFETSRPTSFPHPTYEVDGIIHFCVPNVPSSVARSATQALTNAVLPYLLRIADEGFETAGGAVVELRRGTYLHRGRCLHGGLARAFGVAHEAGPWETAQHADR
jgi:alanine dehydrogenase